MAFDGWTGARFAAGLALRATAIGALAFVALMLIVREHFYATALVAIGIGALLVVDLGRAVLAADRLFAGFVEALAAGAADTPTLAAARFPALAAALTRVADRLGNERIGRERRVQELEALLDTVTAALLIVRADGEVVLANRAARALVGESGARLTEIAALGGAAEQLAALAPGARAIVRLADERRILASAAAFGAAEGERRRLLSLQSLSDELSPVELKAWQDLVRVLAHEMMNSLTPIVSLAESLQILLPPGPGPREDAASAVQVIARRSAGLMSFVERYRRVAELPEPAPEVFGADRFLAGLQRLMGPVLAERGIAYSARVEPAGLQIRADPELLEQAMINLLKNAVEAVGDSAGPRVELLCGAGDGQVSLSVSDNGRGLPQRDPEQIFTPFFTTKAGGSGVGLSLARQIALAHGGTLTVRRNIPDGATFSLALPSGGVEQSPPI